MKIRQTKHRKRVLYFKFGACLLLLILLMAGFWCTARRSNTPSAPAAYIQQTHPSPAAPLEFAPLSETPAQLEIAKIGVEAPIISVGLTPEGAMDDPDNLAEVGWYERSAKAGEDTFSILLAGHYGLDAQPGVFAELEQLVVGDELKLTSENGTELEYIVRETETKPYAEVDMRKALFPYEEGLQSLTIITCEGEYYADEQTYDNRTVVYAERVR